MKISVVIPCYNEASSIQNVLRSLPKRIDEVIVVDNDSNDATASIAREEGARVVVEKRRGYGAAIKRGFESATGDIIVTVDGDGQHPAKEIEPMIALLEGQQLDFVVGSRFPLAGANMGRIRVIGNGLFNVAIRFLFGIRLCDSQSGMWVFRRRVLERIMLESDGMAVSQEIKIKTALDPMLRLGEHHIVCAERIGASKLSPMRDGIKNLRSLFRLKRMLTG